MTVPNTSNWSVEEINRSLQNVKTASRKLVHLADEQIVDILNEVAESCMQNAAYLIAENQKDLSRMDSNDPKYDRLLLNNQRLEAIAHDLKKVAALPSPLRRQLEERQLPNGIVLSRVSVPLGVIGIIYESRPNVTFDVFALCLKSGNACVLKGSRDAHYSNQAIVRLIHQILKPYQLEEVVYLAPSEREALSHILEADQYIDIIIPRGGQGLIQFVREHAKVPVIETGAGIVHTYYDQSADILKGKQIIENAKSRRVSVCNALDTLLIHRSRLVDLPELMHRLGHLHKCIIMADEEAFEVLQKDYKERLLQRARPEDFGTEFLSMKMSIKTVADIDEAIDHIARHSSRHSEAIIAEAPDAIDYFLTHVDAAVVYANASTAFTDGAQFGLGAEIGISTQKLHARGPMALRELCSYKWIAKGDGQIRT